MKEHFYPSIAARVVAHAFGDKVFIEARDKFVELWQMDANAKGDGNVDAREAAGMVAHHLMETAATIALLGCFYSDNDPRISLWIKLAHVHFDRALKNVADAMSEIDWTKEEGWK